MIDFFVILVVILIINVSCFSLFIYSCFFFLLVASETTRVRQNLDNNNESDNSEGTQDNIRYERKNYENPPAKLVHIFHDDDEKNKNNNNADSDEAALNAKDYVFLETISKNSGFIENE